MYFSWNHDTDGGRQLFHCANLHWRCVCAQQQAVALKLLFLAGDKKRVLSIPGRMIRRKVQGLEIVVVGFNLRSLGYRITHLREYPDNLVHGPDDRMLGPKRAMNSR